VGKSVLLTGAAHGLGRELALLLDRESRALTCDLSQPEARRELIAAAQGSVQILINCAGVGSHSAFAQMTVDEVTRVMQVNALAPLELAAGLQPLEALVNIGSVAGEMNLPSMGLYAAGKSALHAFTRAALEGTRSLLVILGPMRGEHFVQSIAHPRTGQPAWYRNLDISPADTEHRIVHALKQGRAELIHPGWYRVVFVLARGFAPLIKFMESRSSASGR
jgi:short-subunit dehydrogenase